MKPIAILGCGPAGLLAAHAVALSRRKFVIYSRPQKSRLGGAQFLHEAIPGLTTEDPYEISIVAEGSAGVYQQKVYGNNERVPFVSFPTQALTTQNAWNLIRAYDQLWEAYSPDIVETEVTAMWLHENERRFRQILSTVPATSICKTNSGMIPEVHMFHSQRIWVYPEAVNPSIPDGTIWYDGTKDRSWYRQSKLFGTGGTEYPIQISPPVQPLIHARKPIWTNCNCFPKVIRLGRYGQWKKGVLTHDAFFGAAEALR